MSERSLTTIMGSIVQHDETSYFHGSRPMNASSTQIRRSVPAAAERFRNFAAIFLPDSGVKAILTAGQLATAVCRRKGRAPRINVR